jgi:histidinol-phosphate aminotransferase
MPYGHDLDAMLDQVDDETSVVFIANPNNPTGTWLGAAELESFIARVPSRVIVVIDEAYFEYVQDGEHANTLKWSSEYPNLVVTRTFSKIYGLAGLRVGYAVSSPELADILNRVRQPFNVNSLALLAAEAALQDRTHLEKSVAMNTQGLEQLGKGLEQLGLECIPSVANFITADMGREAAPVYDALLHDGVIVRPIANYGMPDHLRITVSTQEDNQRVLQSLKKVLK